MNQTRRNTTVFWVLHCSVDEALDAAVYWAVNDVVKDALYASVDRPVHHAVHRDVDRAQNTASKGRR